MLFKHFCQLRSIILRLNILVEERDGEGERDSGSNRRKGKDEKSARREFVYDADVVQVKCASSLLLLISFLWNFLGETKSGSNRARQSEWKGSSVLFTTSAKLFKRYIHSLARSLARSLSACCRMALCKCTAPFDVRLKYHEFSAVWYELACRMRLFNASLSACAKPNTNTVVNEIVKYPGQDTTHRHPNARRKWANEMKNDGVELEQWFWWQKHENRFYTKNTCMFMPRRRMAAGERCASVHAFT